MTNRLFFPIATILLLFCNPDAFSQKPGGYLTVDYSDSYVTPKWFGPYSFPIPEQLEGKICNTLQVSLSGDYVVGSLAGNTAQLRDYTKALTFALKIPLWTDRATLSAWGEIYEWYKDSPKVREIRRVDPVHPLSGGDAGNTFLSLDILALREGKWNPSVALRVATLFATGDEYERARHFDTPGYFFDASVGKAISFGKTSSFRISGTLGFVCWQITKGRQIDALMYGGKLSYSHKYATLNAEIGTFDGREKDGDNPITLNSRLELHFGRFSPFVAYAHGFRDWPFDLFRLGLAVNFDVLK